MSPCENNAWRNDSFYLIFALGRLSETHYISRHNINHVGQKLSPKKSSHFSFFRNFLSRCSQTTKSWSFYGSKGEAHEWKSRKARNSHKTFSLGCHETCQRSIFTLLFIIGTTYILSSSTFRQVFILKTTERKYLGINIDRYQVCYKNCWFSFAGKLVAQ